MSSGGSSGPPAFSFLPMRIQFDQSCVAGDGVYKWGEVADLPDSEAMSYVRAGIARPVETRKVERAVTVGRRKR